MNFSARNCEQRFSCARARDSPEANGTELLSSSGTALPRPLSSRASRHWCRGSKRLFLVRLGVHVAARSNGSGMRHHGRALAAPFPGQEAP